MSRSKKKNPYGNTVCIGRHVMKKWKTQLNRKIRRTVKSLHGGSYYKKINDTWNAPNDGKWCLKTWFEDAPWKAHKK